MSPIRMSLPLALAALLAIPAVTGAKPTNDGRDDAEQITTLPLSIAGSTDGATTQDGEAPSSCAGDTNSVWYRYDAAHDVRVVARLRAGGDPRRHRHRLQAPALRQARADLRRRATPTAAAPSRSPRGATRAT